VSERLRLFDVDGQVLDEAPLAQAVDLGSRLVDLLALLVAHPHHVDVHVQVDVGIARVQIGVGVFVIYLAAIRLTTAIVIRHLCFLIIACCSLLIRRVVVVESDGCLSAGLAFLLVLSGLGLGLLLLIRFSAKLLLDLNRLEKSLLRKFKKVVLDENPVALVILLPGFFLRHAVHHLHFQVAAVFGGAG